MKNVNERHLVKPDTLLITSTKAQKSEICSSVIVENSDQVVYLDVDITNNQIICLSEIYKTYTRADVTINYSSNHSKEGQQAVAGTRWNMAMNLLVS
jgi:tetrahydromethanopterin S-methyltransferase subunit B